MIQLIEISILVSISGWFFTPFRLQQHNKNMCTLVNNMRREVKNTALPEIRFKF